MWLASIGVRHVNGIGRIRRFVRGGHRVLRVVRVAIIRRREPIPPRPAVATFGLVATRAVDDRELELLPVAERDDQAAVVGKHTGVLERLDTSAAAGKYSVQQMRQSFLKGTTGG